MNDKLPIFDALIELEDEGIYNISLVDCPAVESNFLAFQKDKTYQSYSIADEEQHMVFGVLMRCEYLIYRRDESFGEYYIKYSKETIKKMAEKLMADGKQNNVNIMHLPNSNVDGVQMVEIFIKDSEKGISPKGFEDISDGSLFCTFKVHNEDVWNAIKDGTFKGYSLEGIFSVEHKYNKQNKKDKDLMSKIKEMLKSILAEFGTVVTNDGIEIEFEGDTLEIGTAVNVADGEYLAGDVIYLIEDGKVVDIKEKEAEEPTVEEVVEEMEETIEEEPTEEEDKMKEVVETLKAEIDALKTEIEALKTAVAELSAQTVVEPVSEQFEKIEEPLSKWQAIANLKRNK